MADDSGLVIDVRVGDRIDEKDAEAFEATHPAETLIGRWMEVSFRARLASMGCNGWPVSRCAQAGQF